MKRLFRSGPSRLTTMGLGLAALLLVGAACSQGVPQEEVAAEDQRIASLESQVATLQSNVGSLQRDSHFWTQLTEFLEPVQMPSMSDHRAYMLPSGVVVALHFDDMNLNQAENLNWVAVGIPGRFCKSDQEELEAQYGEGFTYFHDMMNDTHGGAPGTEGVWFVHMGVRDFTAPWGPVSPGVDMNFMPTPPPDC